MKDEELFRVWKSEQYKDQSTEEKMEFVEHLHTFPKYFETTFLAGLKAGRPQLHKVADGDLPKDDENFICMLENGYRLECYYDPTSKRWYDNFSHHDIEYGYYQSKVIAWCEIPTFDKE